MCQRHRFEDVWVPRARERGWRESVEWGELVERIEGMRGVLRGVLEDEEGDVGVEDVGVEVEDGQGERRGWGPRKRCVFWREMKALARTAGSKATGGVRGQYNNFEKLQPG